MKSFPVRVETVFFDLVIQYDGQYFLVLLIPNDPNLEEHRTERRFDDFHSAHKVFADLMSEVLRIEAAALENPGDLEHIEWLIERDHDCFNRDAEPVDPEIARLVAEQR